MPSRERRRVLRRLPPRGLRVRSAIGAGSLGAVLVVLMWLGWPAAAQLGAEGFTLRGTEGVSRHEVQDQARTGAQGQGQGQDRAAGQGQAPGSGTNPQAGAPPTAPSPSGAGTRPEQAPPDGANGQPAQPVFRTDINFVRVDAIVTGRDGKPITDLTEADFEVLEDGQPQKIETFKLIRVTGTPVGGGEPAREIRSEYVEEAEAAREDVRLFVIFLDDYHVRRGASMAVREPLIRFLQNDLGPLDMVAIMYPLTPVSVVRFSRNRDILAGAINNFLGRKNEYEPRNELEQQYANYPTETVERIRNQVSLSALKGLVTRLGGLREGRKSVIVVSEGYTYYIPPELRSSQAGINIAGQGGTSSPTGNDPDEFRARMMLQTDMQQDLRSVFDAANRANTALYTLDPRGLATFEYDINERVGLGADRNSLQETQDTLRVLAEETDGRAIVNRNDLGSGLRQAVTDSSAYYLLGYSSSRAHDDGKFHQITVRVKRPRTDVRARKGYWAFTAEEVSRITAPAKPPIDSAVTTALSALELPRRSRVIRTWLGTSRSENGKTRVTFFWEPAPVTPGERRDLPTQVTVTAIAEDGAPYFRGRVGNGSSGGAVPAGDTPPRSGPSAGAASATTSATGGRVEFDVAPGPMRMRLSVEGDGGRVLDSDQVDLTVADFTVPQVRFSTPMVLRARTVPEFRALSANLSAPPTTERTFRRSERVLVRLSAYGPGGSVPDVTARLLNRAGDAMSTVTVETVAEHPELRQMSVPLANLSPGDYLVEVVAKGPDGEVKELIAFRVGA